MEEQPKPPTPLKRPITPFMRYSKQVRKYVTDEKPSLSEEEVDVVISKMWNKMDGFARQKYHEEFIKEKDTYNAECAARLKAGISIEPDAPSTEKKSDGSTKLPAPKSTPKPNKVFPELEHEVLPLKVQTPKPEAFCILCGVKKPGELRVIDPYGARNHMKLLPAAIEEVFSVAVDVRKIINTKSCIKCFNAIMRAQSMRRHYLAVMDGKKVSPVGDFVKYSVKVEDMPTVLPKGAAPDPPSKPSTSSNSHATRATTNLDDAVSKIQKLPTTTAALCRSPSVVQPEPRQQPQIMLQFTPTVTPPTDAAADGEASNTDGANKKAVVTFTLTGITVKRPPNQDHQYCTTVAPAEQAQKILQKCGIFRHTMPTSVTPKPEVDTVVEAFRRNKEVRLQIEKQILSELSSFCNRMNSTMAVPGPSVLRTGLDQLPKTDVVSGCIIELEQSMPFLLDIFKTLCCSSHMPVANTMRTVAMMYGLGMYARNGQFSAMQYLNTMALMRYSGNHLQEVLSKSSLMLSGNGRHMITSKAYHIPSLGLVKSEGVKLTRQRMDNLVDRILRQQNFPVPKNFVPYPIKEEESPPKKSQLLRSGRKKGKLGRIKREKGSKRRHTGSSTSHQSKRVKREGAEGDDDAEEADEQEEVPSEEQETQRRTVPVRVRGKQRSCMAVDDYLQTRVISIDTPPQNQWDDHASPSGSEGKENHHSEQAPSAKRRVAYDTATGKNGTSKRTPSSSNHKNIRQQLILSQGVSETQMATQVLEGSLGMGANGGHLLVEDVSSFHEEQRNNEMHQEEEIEICWEYDPDQEGTSTETTHTDVYVVDHHGAQRTDNYQCAGSQETPIVLGALRH